MIITAHMNFFRIGECGLYKYGDTFPAGLSYAETFDLIYDWAKGKPMADTIPWDPLGGRNNKAKCYCHDLFKCDDTGDFVFVLWKSETNGAGSIWGAQAAAQTGQSSVIEYTNNYKGKAVIWGRPCYYWVIPSLNTIVSIKFDNSVCDAKMLEDWVEKCITNRVQHPNKTKSSTETGLIRFEFTSQDQSPQTRYAFRFNISLRSLDTGHAQLQDLARRVTHLVRRETIKLNSGTDERAAWVKLFDKIPHVRAKPNSKTRQIEVRAEAKPTAAEIKQIIEDFALENRKRSDWDNVGFATDNSIVWVDSYRLHEQVNFNSDKEKIFSAGEIFSRIAQHRDRILAPVNKDERVRSTLPPTVEEQAA
jgi:hypothetical protein